jgi:Concanavalin A-like lectin/glucanases superfamily
MTYSLDSHARFLARMVMAGALVCGGIVQLGFAPPAPSAPTPSGLVGRWSAEGNANDATGRHNGTLSGGATFAPGKVGQAFSFDPASGTVIVPDSTALRLSDQLTIVAWIKTRNTDSDQAIVSKVGGVTGNNGYQFAVSGSTLIGQFNTRGEGWPSARVTSGEIIKPGVWYHVAWTYDQSAMVLYVNGVAAAKEVIGPQTITASSSDLRISGDDNEHVYFDGLIDEVSLYDRALSSAEIETLYGGSGAGTGRATPGKAREGL